MPTGRWHGVASGLAIATIAAGWSVITRMEVISRVDAWDIAALRFGVAGVLLAPIAVHRGLTRERVGWFGLTTMIIGGGVPYALLAAGGLRFAPAYEQSALNPGTTPLFVATLAAAVSDERLSATRCAGLALILVGIAGMVGWHSAAWRPSRLMGELMFLTAGFLWACYTVAMRRSRLDPLHAAALVSTGSLIVYLPVYFALHGTHLLGMPLQELAVQATFQGLIVTVVIQLLYGRAISHRGVSGGAAFLALVPAFAAVFAIVFLGEWPDNAGWAAVGLISLGVYLASGRSSPSRTTDGLAITTARRF